jgi:hypothetical protein
MRKFVAMSALALGLGVALPAFAQDAVLVGYTTITRNGAAGVLVMNEDCDNRFAGTRMCTSGDLLLGNLPVRPGDPSSNVTNWILPTAVGTVNGAAVTLIDASGKTGTPASFTCDGFSSAAASVTGLTASDLGRIVLAPCNVARNIACCAPLSP